MFNTFPNVVADELQLVRTVYEIFKRARERAHAAFDSLRQQLFQQIEQPIRVVKPRQVSPVRRVNLLFYGASMETAKWEPVKCENVALVPFEPTLELQELAPVT